MYNYFRCKITSIFEKILIFAVYFFSMRKIIYILAMFPLLLSCEGVQSKLPKGKEHVDSVRLLVNDIQKCSKLHTSEYHIRKIITHKDNLRAKGKIYGRTINIPIPAGDRNIAIPIDATVNGYIDFSQFGPENVIKNGPQIEIILPDPVVEMSSTKVDRKGVSEHVSLFRKDFSDEEIAHYEQEGRKEILKTIPLLDITSRARLSATRILVPMMTKMGYDEKNIVITFRKEFDSQQLKIISPEKKP